MKILFILWFQIFSSMALACIHYPKDYKESLREGLQEVFLFHDGTNAHMVISTQLSADQFPKEISWVLPLSSVPSKYEEVV